MAVPRRDGQQIVLQAGTTEVLLDGEGADLAEQVISLCDGTRTLEDILGRWPQDQQDVRSLIASLEDSGVLADCTRVFRLFHQQSSNGSNPFYVERTEEEILEIMAMPRWEPESASEQIPLERSKISLEPLFKKRSSAFPDDSGNELDYQGLSTIISSMNRIVRDEHRTVPSAGALYPLVIHVAVRELVGNLSSGTWWYDSDHEALALVSQSSTEVSEVILNAEPSDTLLRESDAVIFISADLERSARKYANRAYRYAMLETGAVMQNASLAAAELGVKLRPIGGFHDQKTQEFLGLSGDMVPLLALIVGG